MFLYFSKTFFPTTPPRVRGEYSRVRAYPCKAVCCSKTLYRASGLHFSCNTSPRVRGEYSRVLVSPFFCFFVFFVVGFFFSVLLHRCVISFGADHLYSIAVDKQQKTEFNLFPGASGPPPSARARCAANSASQISPGDQF